MKQAATDDVLNLHQSVGHAPVDVTAALLSPLIPLVYLFTVDVRFALLLVAYFVVVIGVAWPFMMRDFGPLNKRFNEAMVEVSSAASRSRCHNDQANLVFLNARHLNCA